MRLRYLLLMVLLIGLLLSSSCSVFDECKSKFKDCNYDCGEGILSSLCKEKCTYQYNQCEEEGK